MRVIILIGITAAFTGCSWGEGMGADGISGEISKSYCTSGATLKFAETKGCCLQHGGVAGPSDSRTCCNGANQVVCKDGSVSDSCACSK